MRHEKNQNLSCLMPHASCRHPCMIFNDWNPCTISDQYVYRIGAVKKIESKRSRNPPWPGIRVPESFTSAERFHIDSARSPTTPLNERITPAMIACSSGKLWKNVKWMITAVMTDVRMPPTKPSTVFFGLMRGESLWRPNVLPV